MGPVTAALTGGQRDRGTDFAWTMVIEIDATSLLAIAGRARDGI